MRRFLVSLLLPAALLAGKAVRADTLRLGYVDVQRAVSEVDEGKQATSSLRAEADEKRKQLEVKQSALQKMKADYDKQASVLSDDAKRKKQEELQKALIQETQQALSDAQDEFQRKQQTAMASISQRMIQVISIIAEKDNLTYVLDKAAALYGPPSGDVTNEVIRLYNEKFSVPGGTDAKSTAATKKPGK